MPENKNFYADEGETARVGAEVNNFWFIDVYIWKRMCRYVFILTTVYDGSNLK